MRVLSLVLLVLAALGVFAVSLFRRDVRGPIGTSLVYDDFVFDVLGVERAASIGDLHARGEFRMVRLRLTNGAQRVEHPFPHHRVIVIDPHGDHYEVDAAAQAAFERAHPSNVEPALLAVGAQRNYVRVFDVPRDARLELAISWGGALIDLVDNALIGERRIVLD